jgi:TonB family protein
MGSVAALALLFCLSGGAVPAQSQKTSKSDRKVLVSVKPDYADFLKRAQIGGLVRLKVTVSSEGRVSNVDIVGGNPILAESAANAVLQWKFAPATTKTIEEISLNFNPH